MLAIVGTFSLMVLGIILMILGGFNLFGDDDK